jgi:hypothetical protein
LTDQGTLAEEIRRPEQAKYGFLSGPRQDGDLHFPSLKEKYRISRIALSKDLSPLSHS